MIADRAAWHARADELAAYWAGECADVLAASLEAHLVRCDRCRAALAEAAGPAETDRRWMRLADAVDRPTVTISERIGLGRFLDSGLGRTALASPTMRTAWLASLALVVGVPLAAAASVGADASTMLLALAPVAPVLAVALAYRDTSDPAGAIMLATPWAGLRLVAARALLVSGGAVPLGLVAGAVMGVPVRLSMAWLLPGLALAALVLLAGTTRWDPLHVAAAAGGSWAVAVASPSPVRGVAARAVADTIASPALQSAALGVAAVALLLTVARRDAVAYRRTA